MLGCDWARSTIRYYRLRSRLTHSRRRRLDRHYRLDGRRRHRRRRSRFRPLLLRHRPILVYHLMIQNLICIVLLGSSS